MRGQKIGNPFDWIRRFLSPGVVIRKDTSTCTRLGGEFCRVRSQRMAAQAKCKTRCNPSLVKKRRHNANL